MSCEQLSEELEQLRGTYGEVTAEEESSGDCWIRIARYPLPQVWPVESCRVALRVSVQYPLAKPDLVYTDPSLGASIGKQLPNIMGIEQLRGEDWAKISWHWNGPWDPTKRHLSTFVRSLRTYFTQAR